MLYHKSSAAFPHNHFISQCVHSLNVSKLSSVLAKWTLIFQKYFQSFSFSFDPNGPSTKTFSRRTLNIHLKVRHWTWMSLLRNSPRYSRIHFWSRTTFKSILFSIINPRMSVDIPKIIQKFSFNVKLYLFTWLNTETYDQKLTKITFHVNQNFVVMPQNIFA